MKESLLNPVMTFTSSYFIFLPPQISAVALCIGGIVMMAYAEGFAGPNVVGVILSVTAGCIIISPSNPVIISNPILYTYHHDSNYSQFDSKQHFNSPSIF